uniref:Uncharacterized protein n=1 Tax=Oryza rufipogon TaxID=4529 RepID=A0A0E0R1P7_ORYRU
MSRHANEAVPESLGWNFLAYSTTLSTSCRTALAASSSPKRPSHAASSGALAASKSLAPESLSLACTHDTRPPSTTSTYPAVSPPKKGFPLDNSLNAVSRFSIAASICFTASAFSSSELNKS